MARLLPFQRQMVEELLADDGLCIMSAGMGWYTVRTSSRSPTLPAYLLCCASEQVPAVHALAALSCCSPFGGLDCLRAL